MMNRSVLGQYYEILTLLRSGPLGRRTLVAKSTMTESTVRTHLRWLELHGYVRSEKQGTSITPAARHAFSELLSRVTLLPDPHVAELAVDHCGTAALVSETGPELRQSVRYRDEAVRGGATGAVLLTYSEDTWYFSDSSSRLPEVYPQDAAALRRTLDAAHARPRETDGLILSFGPTDSVARSGLWSVIAALIPSPLSTDRPYLSTSE